MNNGSVKGEVDEMTTSTSCDIFNRLLRCQHGAGERPCAANLLFETSR